MEDPHFGQATVLLDSVVDQALQLLSRTTGWEDLGAKEGVTGGKIPAGESALQVRVQTVINRTPEQIHAFLWEFTNKPRWDDVIKEIRMVKPLGDHMRIMYEQSNAPWPVSNRDMVYAQRYVERPDGIMILNKSIDIGVPENKGVVRAEVLFSSIYLKRIGDGSSTELTSVGSIDPKGSIPNAIVNKSAKKQITKIIALRKALGA